MAGGATTRLGRLMERNVSEVFGERDPGRRERAIAELYATIARSATRKARASARQPSLITSGASSTRPSGIGVQRGRPR